MVASAGLRESGPVYEILDELAQVAAKVHEALASAALHLLARGRIFDQGRKRDLHAFFFSLLQRAIYYHTARTLTWRMRGHWIAVRPREIAISNLPDIRRSRQLKSCPPIPTTPPSPRAQTENSRQSG